VLLCRSLNIGVEKNLQGLEMAPGQTTRCTGFCRQSIRKDTDAFHTSTPLLYSLYFSLHHTFLQLKVLMVSGQQHLKFRVSVSVQKRKDQNIFNKKTAHSLYCVKVFCMKIRFFHVLLHNYF
jgi:hypothetical protein